MREVLKRVGYPIRTPSDQGLLATSPTISLAATSFIGPNSQGIHCLLYLKIVSIHFSKSHIHVN